LQQRIDHQRLAHVCSNDFSRGIALVLDRLTPAGEHEILGVARLVRDSNGAAAEFAIVLSDRWQHQGLGMELTRCLLRIGRSHGIRLIRAFILPANHEMLRLAQRFGFELDRSHPGEIVAELQL
jgi:acetyltransferase